MKIAQHLIRQSHLRHGTKEERELYRYAVRIERGRRNYYKNKKEGVAA